MKLRRPAVWTAGAFLLLGVICVTVRLKTRQNAHLAQGDTVWRLTYDISFSAARSDTGIRAALPYNTRHSRVFGETFLYPRSSMYNVRNRRTAGREAIAVSLGPSSQSRFIAHFDIHVSSRERWPSDSAQAVLTTTDRARYLRAEKTVQINSPPVTELLSTLTQEKLPKDALLDRIFRYCSEDIAPGTASSPTDAAGVLEQRAAGALGRARAMVALCRASRLPARLVTGFVLENGPALRPHVWLQVYAAKQWVPYDPENGYARDLPPTYVPLRLDDSQVVTAFDGVSFRAKFSAHRMNDSVGALASQENRLLDIVDLTRLAPSMQRTLGLILLLPLGALVTSIFRNLIGIQTFGTFTPSLLALSFVRADWRTGVVVLIVVMGIGLTGRVLVNRLKLLMVPRLSVVLTLVVLSLTIAISALDYFGLTPAAAVVLLPMVILTMIIERFHISAEEDGVSYSLMLLAGTLVVGFCCFTVLRVDVLARLALRFPEGQFFILAALILIGRYAGYRLTELWRFRDIGQAHHPEDTK